MIYSTPEIKENIDFAVSLKRKGRADEAIGIYEVLDAKYPYSGAINSSWGKALATEGYYNKALEKFLNALKFFYEDGLEDYAGQYMNHHKMLESYKERGYNTNDNEFYEYILGLSGQSREMFRIKQARG